MPLVLGGGGQETVLHSRHSSKRMDSNIYRNIYIVPIRSYASGAVPTIARDTTNGVALEMPACAVCAPPAIGCLSEDRSDRRNVRAPGVSAPGEALLGEVRPESLQAAAPAGPTPAAAGLHVLRAPHPPSHLLRLSPLRGLRARTRCVRGGGGGLWRGCAYFQGPENRFRDERPRTVSIQPLRVEPRPAFA